MKDCRKLFSKPEARPGLSGAGGKWPLATMAGDPGAKGDESSREPPSVDGILALGHRNLGSAPSRSQAPAWPTAARLTFPTRRVQPRPRSPPAGAPPALPHRLQAHPLARGDGGHCGRCLWIWPACRGPGLGRSAGGGGAQEPRGALWDSPGHPGWPEPGHRLCGTATHSEQPAPGLPWNLARPLNGSCQGAPDAAAIRRLRRGQWPGTSPDLLSSSLTGNHWGSVASIYQADAISSNSCHALLFRARPKITASPGGEGALPSPGRDAVCTSVCTEPLASRSRVCWLCSTAPSPALLLDNSVGAGQPWPQLKDGYSSLPWCYRGSGQWHLVWHLVSLVVWQLWEVS